MATCIHCAKQLARADGPVLLGCLHYICTECGGGECATEAGAVRCPCGHDTCGQLASLPHGCALSSESGDGCDGEAGLCNICEEDAAVQWCGGCTKAYCSDCFVSCKCRFFVINIANANSNIALIPCLDGGAAEQCSCPASSSQPEAPSAFSCKCKECWFPLTAAASVSDLDENKVLFSVFISIISTTPETRR
jgi:hypothetical protein